MRIVDDLIAEPAEIVPERTEFSLSQAGLAVVRADWGESAIEQTMVRTALGEEPVTRRPQNKESVLNLRVRKEGEVDLATAAYTLQQQVGAWQERRGWLRRDFIYGNFAGPVACMVKRAALSGFAGWQAGESPDVQLSLLTSFLWYAVEEDESEVIE